jgi:hypothetical protein
MEKINKLKNREKCKKKKISAAFFSLLATPDFRLFFLLAFAIHSLFPIDSRSPSSDPLENSQFTRYIHIIGRLLITELYVE